MLQQKQLSTIKLYNASQGPIAKEKQSALIKKWENITAH